MTRKGRYGYKPRHATSTPVGVLVARTGSVLILVAGASLAMVLDDSGPGQVVGGGPTPSPVVSSPSLGQSPAPPGITPSQEPAQEPEPEPSQEPAQEPADVPAQEPGQAGGVPQVVGVRLDRAGAMLHEVGYSRVVVRDVTGTQSVVDPRDWVVVEQLPRPGSEVSLRKGAMLVVAPAGGRGRVPDARCMDLASAQAVFRSAGFSVVSTVDSTGNPVSPRGSVVSWQSLRPGTQARRGTTVTLHGQPGSC